MEFYLGGLNSYFVSAAELEILCVTPDGVIPAA